VVTADGELLRVSAHEHPDLFWGLKGGGGNFGIVTSMEFAIYPLTTVYGGNLFYPLEMAREVLELYSEWVDTLPDEMTTAVAFMNFPPLPEIPEPLRRGAFISVRGCYCGDPSEAGEELLRHWREFGEPEIDMFGVMPFQQMDMISMDPPDPLGVYTRRVARRSHPGGDRGAGEYGRRRLQLAADHARAAPPGRGPGSPARGPEPYGPPRLQVPYVRRGSHPDP
jgi:hypothetical protein